MSVGTPFTMDLNGEVKHSSSDANWAPHEHNHHQLLEKSSELVNGNLCNGYTTTVELSEEDPYSGGKKKRGDAISRTSVTRANHIRKMILAIVFLGVACIANNIVLALIHERVPRHIEPLPDLWFKLFPELTYCIKIAEILIFCMVVATIAILLLHEQRWIVLRRIFTIAAICYAGRAVVLCLTQVPVPSRKTYCGPQINKTSFRLYASRVFYTFTGMGLDLYHERVLCGDLVYSGHTITLMLSHLAIHQYGPKRRLLGPLLSWLSWFGAIGSMISILLARKHYTIDIAFAYYVTTRVFWIYHALVDSASRSSRLMGENPLTRVMWYPVFRFFESETLTPLTLNGTSNRSVSSNGSVGGSAFLKGLLGKS